MEGQANKSSKTSDNNNNNNSIIIDTTNMYIIICIYRYRYRKWMQTMMKNKVYKINYVDNGRREGDAIITKR